MTTTPERNIPLLRKTLEHIVAEPELWHQENWTTPVMDQQQACGTAFCFAGWAAVFAGYDLDHVGNCYQNGELVSHVEFVASDELGISAEEALTLGRDDRSHGLFAPGNTLDDLKAQVYHLTDGEVDMR